MHGQVHRCQVGCAGLRLVAISFYGTTHAAPNVDLIGQLEWDLKIVVGGSIGGDTCRPVTGDSVSCGTRARGDRGEKIGPLVTEKCTSLCVLSLQGIELRILKDFPPVAVDALIIRLGGLPVSNLFVGCRNFSCGASIIGSHSASGE